MSAKECPVWVVKSAFWAALVAIVGLMLWGMNRQFPS